MMRWVGLFVLVGCAPVPPIGLNEIGPTWAELGNRTDAGDSIGGWTVQLELRTPWTVPEGTDIAAGGYRVIEGLEIPGGVLKVRDASGELVEEVDVPALGDGKSYARLPDGTGGWKVVDTPTRGDPNGG
ncbi:MAG: hypothetical protein R3F61_24355 [Myxococcota bacterium]